jgi:6,7-dimethyl-8-ribityllumazine synthase
MAGKSSSGKAPAAIRAHVLIIEARYYGEIADALLDGAKAALADAGATYEVVTVPGALEIPQALVQAVATGLIPADVEGAKFDGAVALGCVIRGETTHYETVCTEANRALMTIAIDAAVPVGNAILTVETEAQAKARAEGGLASKGADAVRACLALVALARTFDEASQ